MADSKPDYYAWYDLSKEFEQNSSLENYLRCVDAGVDLTFWIDRFDTCLDVWPPEVQLANRTAIKAAALDPLLFAGAAPGHTKDINELALQLCRRLAQQREPLRTGETAYQRQRAAIPNEIIGFAVAAIVSGLHNSRQPPPLSFVMFIREWLERVDIHRVQICALTIDSMDMNALGVCS